MILTLVSWLIVIIGAANVLGAVDIHNFGSVEEPRDFGGVPAVVIDLL